MTNIYCSKACLRAAEYDEREGWRAHVRAALKCVDCGGPIPEAKRQDKRLCGYCKHKRRLANCVKNRQRTKAGTNGRRGTNQHGRVE
ncbi:hypothetical protein [Methylocystis echinoides]|uniref:Uncharacterized protein n=1 Tax=Methylocystis echinoides TaxID=29468 RepID=A0A9W6GVQ3_9HYPH|nr:hypothetical protein [Methylocystis echinoides]GLI93942.1 hypothetical protein LMG27198_29340 [Methylocystis echinoides]